MKREFIPYILPAATIFGVLIAALFFRPSITGFAVSSQKELNVEIKITGEEIIPELSLVNIYVADAQGKNTEILSTTIRDIVNTYDLNLSYEKGTNQFISYEGFGYIGESIFNITQQNIRLENGPYILRTEIWYNDSLISQGEQQLAA